MTLEKPICYSAISSLAFHLVFVLVVGVSWLTQNNTPIPENPFRLKMVKRTPPPPPLVKREKMRVETFKKKVIPVKPVVMPQPKPERVQTMMVQRDVQMNSIATVAPRAFKPFEVLKTHSIQVGKRARIAPGRVATSAVFAPPRKLAAVDHTKSPVEDGIMARVKRTFTPVNMGSGPRSLDLLPIRKTGRGGNGRMARVGENIIPVDLPFSGPRKAPAGFVDRGAARGYLVGIRRKISSAKQYPRVARNSGQEGRVQVRFTILQDGQVERLFLLAETPYPALNKEALEMIRRAAPFSRLPEAIGLPSLEVVLPFTFQLN